jgi:hypothetical protein
MDSRPAEGVVREPRRRVVSGASILSALVQL